MKKGFILIMAILLSFSLYGCGGGRGTSKCTICGKSATHTFQGSGYCNTHYADAVAWAAGHIK